MPVLDEARLTTSAAALEARIEAAAEVCEIVCAPDELTAICTRLTDELGCVFATLVVEDTVDAAGRPVWSLRYFFYRDRGPPWLCVELSTGARNPVVPSISGLATGPSVDWHEREVEDLFRIAFEGHPRLGEFILHEDWPEGIAPMRRAFDPRRRLVARQPDPRWQPPTIVEAPGAFSMPIGPVFSDFAEFGALPFGDGRRGRDPHDPALLLQLPRRREDRRGAAARPRHPAGGTVLRHRGVRPRPGPVPGGGGDLQGNGAAASRRAAHGVLRAGAAAPPRGDDHRHLQFDSTRRRDRAGGADRGRALRLSGEVARHRYLFGVAAPGGVGLDLSEAQCRRLASGVASAADKLRELGQMLTYSSSFLDRLEEVGIVSAEAAARYGLVGPIARASGIARDIRRLFPYAAYASANFAVPVETEGDGYARLRLFFREAEQSAALVRQFLAGLPAGPIAAAGPVAWRAGAALAAVEAPSGAAFHWLRLGEEGIVRRYRVTPPAFPNWHGFHLAAENFAFQDFPIILASFGLSNAECDR